MRVAGRTWIRRLTTSSQNPGHRPTPHPHKQAPPPPGRRSIHDPGGTGARFCRNLRIRAEGTLRCSEVRAPDLRGHWVYRGESGVGSVLTPSTPCDPGTGRRRPGPPLVPAGPPTGPRRHQLRPPPACPRSGTKMTGPGRVGCANPRSCRRPAGRICSGGHHGSHVAGPDSPYVPAQ